MKVKDMVNYKQTKAERRRKYKSLIRLGFSSKVARRLRDWTNPHVKKFKEIHTPDNAKFYERG